MILNWTPPVITLLHQLQRQGFELVAVDDGQETIKIDSRISASRQRAIAADAITSVDMSHLHVRKNGSKAWLYLVLGNEADEIPADWSARLPLAVDLDVAVDRYRDIWENKPVPTKLA